METLGRILEGAITGGLSKLVAYLLLIACGGLVIRGVYRWIRWRIRRAFQRKKEAMKDAVIGAPGRAVRGAAGAVSNLVGGAIDKIAGRKPEPPPTFMRRMQRRLLGRRD